MNYVSGVREATFAAGLAAIYTTGHAGDVDPWNGFRFLFLSCLLTILGRSELAWRFGYENRQAAVDRPDGMSHR